MVGMLSSRRMCAQKGQGWGEGAWEYRLLLDRLDCRKRWGRVTVVFWSGGDGT